MSNPYESPQSSSYAAGGGDDQQALAKVKPPAITMIVLVSIMMFIVVIGLAFNILGTGLAAADNAGGMMLQGIWGIIQGVVGLLLGAFIIFGCLEMMKLRNYGMAMGACIVAMLPFISPCCCIGLTVGIWGIVVLNDPIVKASFR